MKTLLVFLFVVGGLMIEGCGSSGSSTPPPPDVTADNTQAVAPEAEGVWQSPCQNENGAYQMSEYSIHGGTMSYDVQRYSDPQCTTGGTVVTHFDGRYRAGNRDQRDGSRHFNVQIDHCTGDCGAYGGDRVFRVQNNQLYTDNNQMGFRHKGG